MKNIFKKKDSNSLKKTKIITRLRNITKSLKKEILIYKNVLKDVRTPLFPKIILFLALSYLLMPFDLIPDFIPVLGHVDDAIIIPLMVYTALKFIPKEIIDEYRITEIELNTGKNI